MISISHPDIGKEEINSVLRVLKSGIIVQGPTTEKFEKQFAKLCNTKYAVAVNNGTSALHTAVHAAGITTGDEVITTPFTFSATANSILMCGAKPVFADIVPQTYNIDPSAIEKKLTKKTKAILAVNLYGLPADYSQIRKIAKKHNLTVIEDAAQSVGASQKNKMSGELGDIACFSFYATKNITSGEGGMITTNNKLFYEKMLRFRNHGQVIGKRYEYTEVGYNYRLSDIMSAIGVAQLKKLTAITKKRQKTAQEYSAAFSNINGLITPYTPNDFTHVFHQYTLRITDDFKLNRTALQKYLLKKGIQSNIYYPAPLNHFSYLKDNLSYPVTDTAAQQVLSLPVHPQLSSADVQYIIDTITRI